MKILNLFRLNKNKNQLTVLKNIPFKKYLIAKNRKLYDYAIDFGFTFNKPVDHLKIGDFNTLPFGYVKEWEQELENGLRWDVALRLISERSGASLKKLGKMRIVELCQQLSYVKNQVNIIREVERTLLAYSPSGNEIDAGIEEFAKFGAYPQLRQYAKSFPGMTPSDVEKLRYDVVLLELIYLKAESDFQQRLFKKMKMGNS